MLRSRRSRRSNGQYKLSLQQVLIMIMFEQDVVTFLSWAAEPEMDDRKLMGAKFISVLMLCLITAVYYKRWKWAPIKSRR